MKFEKISHIDRTTSNQEVYNKIKTLYFISRCLEHRVIKVFIVEMFRWTCTAELSRWTTVDELLETILNSSARPESAGEIYCNFLFFVNEIIKLSYFTYFVNLVNA